MKAKNISISMLVVIVMISLFSCGEKRTFVYDGVNFVTFIDSAKKVSETGENGAGEIKVEVALGTGHVESSIGVNFTATPNADLTLGTADGQLEMVTTGRTVIGRGSSFGEIIMVFNDDLDQIAPGVKRLLKLELTGTSESGFEVGYPATTEDYTFGKVFTLEILDDDCPPVSAGAWRNFNNSLLDAQGNTFPAQRITIATNVPNNNSLTPVSIPDLVAAPLMDDEAEGSNIRISGSVQVVGRSGIIPAGQVVFDGDVTVPLEDGTSQRLFVTITILEGSGWDKCNNIMTLNYQYEGLGDRGDNGAATNTLTFID